MILKLMPLVAFLVMCVILYPRAARKIGNATRSVWDRVFTPQVGNVDLRKTTFNR
jgi:hypothetical protein